MAKNQSVESQRMKYYIHSLICVVIMFGFQFIPPFTDSITQTGMDALGIFLGGVVWMDLCQYDLAIPAGDGCLRLYWPDDCTG